MTQLPIPVHIGSEPPATWDDIEDRQRKYGDQAAPHLQQLRWPAVADTTLDWSALGFEPRWVGFDTADCAAALQPSIFSGRGAAEFDRFRQGARSRDELALVVSALGRPDGEDPIRNIFSTSDDSVHLGRMESSISSRPLGRGSTARAVDNLRDADGHLARRLLTCNPSLPWRALSLQGVTYEAHTGTIHHPAQGTLEPIIVTELGEPVVAAWVAPDGNERRYIVPIETPWPVLLRWLIEQALPEYVPGAIRRSRRHLATDQALMTRRERVAHAALADLEADYAARRADLTRELEDAQQAASVLRDGLLYGTGTPLVDAVRSILEWAGMTVVDLDAQLGGTKNADLLCSYVGHARLIEVKSASGSAPERAYEDLVRHLREWDRLPDSTPVDGGALVINHQHRAAPGERPTKPYGRPEFLAAQTEPGITTLDLSEAWRQDNAAAVRRLLFGEEPAPTLAEQGSDASVSSANQKRRWFRRE